MNRKPTELDVVYVPETAFGGGTGLMDRVDYSLYRDKTTDKDAQRIGLLFRGADLMHAALKDIVDAQLAKAQRPWWWPFKPRLSITVAQMTAAMEALGFAEGKVKTARITQEMTDDEIKAHQESKATQ